MGSPGGGPTFFSYHSRPVTRLRPYLLHVYLLTYTPLLLVADSRLPSLPPQYGLGLLTFAVLYLSTRYLPRGDRAQVWVLVAVATCFEIVGSLIWGVYRYRFHNLPLYVPPGHGLVYVFGLTAARTPLFRLRFSAVRATVLAAAALWAGLGLFLLPGLTGRVDAVGALCLPLFAWFLLRSPRAGLFAAIFVAVAELEIVGTGVRTWTWLPVQPWSHLPSGNPPSVIAGGYCVIDGSVLALFAAWRWARSRGRARALLAAPAAAPAEA